MRCQRVEHIWVPDIRHARLRVCKAAVVGCLVEEARVKPVKGINVLCLCLRQADDGRGTAAGANHEVSSVRGCASACMGLPAGICSGNAQPARSARCRLGRAREGLPGAWGNLGKGQPGWLWSKCAGGGKMRHLSWE